MTPELRKTSDVWNCKWPPPRPKSEISAQKKEALFDELSSVITSDVKPGYELILQYMESNYSNANQHHGVWKYRCGFQNCGEMFDDSKKCKNHAQSSSY